MTPPLRIGVLAFQGAFAEHECSLRRAGEGISGVAMEIRRVRTPQDLPGLQALILPGGESTTMSKFLQKNNFKDALDLWMKGENGRRPLVWGTCAGLILLANRVLDTKQGGQLTLGGLDITADRNKYGRQNESFEASVRLTNGVINCGNSTEEDETYKGVFIRAPGIESVDSASVQVLAELENEATGVTAAVAAQQDNLIVTAFHPELTEDLRWHTHFLRRVMEGRA